MSQGLWVCPIKIAGMYDYIRRIKILLWVLLHPPYLADVTTRDRVGGVLRHHVPHAHSRCCRRQLGGKKTPDTFYRPPMCKIL